MTIETVDDRIACSQCSQCWQDVVVVEFRPVVHVHRSLSGLYRFGQVIKEAIESWPSEKRVAVFGPAA